MYSTGFPNAYKDDLNCEWQIISPSKDQIIKIEFLEVNIFDNEDGCFDDEKLEIYKGSKTNPKYELIDVICGSTSSMPPARVVKMAYPGYANTVYSFCIFEIFKTLCKILRFKRN